MNRFHGDLEQSISNPSISNEEDLRCYSGLRFRTQGRLFDVKAPTTRQWMTGGPHSLLSALLATFIPEKSRSEWGTFACSPAGALMKARPLPDGRTVCCGRCDSFTSHPIRDFQLPSFMSLVACVFVPLA
jgi:hypothetical protein